jgi:hypothetical protein
MGDEQDDRSVDGSSLSPADSPGRFRGRFLLGLAAVVVLLVAMQGISLWPRLPDRIPIHFGISGAPDGWSGKNWFSVFGMLVMAAVLLVILGLASSELLGARHYNFPGKERVLKLSREQQGYALAPLREGFAWLASGCTIGLALMARESWQVAMGSREGISSWTMLVPLGVGLAATVIGIVYANRRARELGEGE